MSRTENTDTLQDIGRASIQIVHDLKNQLNGLKLYATFLRRRLEKADRPDDEQDTINKLISGLDRAANDLSTIVQYGHEIGLTKQTGFDLQKAMRTICSHLNETTAPVVCDSDSGSLQGDFDPTKLTDAFKWISVAAIRHRRNENGPGPITVSMRLDETEEKQAIIEWSGLHPLDHDPFRSFAGTDEIRLSLAAKIIEAHGGSAQLAVNKFVVILPLLI